MSDSRAAGLGRRVGAMLYDSLVLIALLMAWTFALLPFTDGEALTWETVGWLEIPYRLTLPALVVGFFGLFWTRRGQTLGMLAWRLRVVRFDGGPLRWGDVLRRLAGAAVSWLPCGLGYLWLLVDRDRLAWHDRWSRTRVVHEPKARNEPRARKPGQAD